MVKANLDGWQDVAVKYMNASEATEFEVSQFASEMTMLRACKHPNVVALRGGWLDKAGAQSDGQHLRAGFARLTSCRHSLLWPAANSGHTWPGQKQQMPDSCGDPK